jgi:hypothetical protein
MGCAGVHGAQHPAAHQQPAIAPAGPPPRMDESFRPDSAMPLLHPVFARLLRLAGVGLLASALGGCTVIAIGGLAVGAAVGAVKLTGQAVGAAADLIIPDSDEKK